MGYLYIVGVFLLIHYADFVWSDLPICKNNQVTYTYTECNQDNGRWTIQVPKTPGICQIDKPEQPVWRKTCSFKCDPGHYLDLASQTCLSCPVGTYSLGSGIRFDIWKDFPDDFTTHSEAVMFTQYGYKTKVNNCSLSLWKTTGYSVVSNNDDCTSTLRYSVNLKQPGSIKFTYQYSDINVIFHFFVQNNQCQMTHDKAKNVFLNTTGTKWNTWEATLNKGPNVLNWRTTGIMIDSRKKLNPVRIREIEITGVSYTTKCQKCRAGTIAPEPASRRCVPCPVDTFSTDGAASCTQCDLKQEFAPSASDHCIKRPACTVKDYFKTHSACDANKMTRIAYKWIQPKICLETINGSVILPPSGRTQPCSPCNPGYYPTGTGCVLCPPNTYSNGTHACKPCPANTSPHYGNFYLWWDSLPRMMKSSCISPSEDACLNDQGWEPVGDQVQTLSINSDEAYLVLLMTLPGFMSRLEEGAFGRITFAFQIECDGSCQFYFMLDREKQGTSVIETWTGWQAEQTYTYDVNFNDTSISFTWAFKKNTETDLARIYLINSTNVLGSSADSCTPCAVGNARDSKCIPCPPGSFLNLETRKCQLCVGNTALSPDKTSCLPCGLGTTATSDHMQCTSDCTYRSISTGRLFDFKNLSTTASASTLPSYTGSGRQYDHVFNISLCNNQGRGVAECVDNVTYARSGLFGQQSIRRLTAMVCRSTVVPMLGAGNLRFLVHSQPTTIASYLISVSDPSPTNTSDQIFPKDNPSDPDDVIYHMGAAASVDLVKCPNGKHTYIHLRCSPDVDGASGRIEMSSACLDGSCSGCDFHFLWRSLAACPMCTSGDYKEVTGACRGGKVTTTYIWKRYPRKCRDGTPLPPSSSTHCTDVMVYVEIGVFVALVVLLVTCVLICKLYKKNRKLQYKYHRLVVDGMGDKNSSDLPTADSCAISNSDSDYDVDNDEVVFQKKKARLFGKKKVNNYESVSLKPTTTGV